MESKISIYKILLGKSMNIAEKFIITKKMIVVIAILEYKKIFNLLNVVDGDKEDFLVILH
jgi:hypothetical protein